LLERGIASGLDLGGQGKFAADSLHPLVLRLLVDAMRNLVILALLVKIHLHAGYSGLELPLRLEGRLA